jgi:branched-chain amino acid transport system permease protein
MSVVSTLLSPSLIATTLIFIIIWGMLAIGLNMHWGEAGLLNFAHAAFFAVGAYTSAILTTPPPEGGGILEATRTIGFNFPIVVGMIGAVVVTAVIGIAIGATSIRLADDYLAIVTLAGAELIRLVIVNQGSLTAGTKPIKNIPRPLEGTFREVLGLGLPYSVYYVGISGLVLIGTLIVFRRLSDSPFGRVLNAIREDEDVPKALGRDTGRYKLKAFGLGAGVAGLAGALFAHSQNAIIASQFTASLTFIIWAAVIIGGSGSYVGALAGAAVILGIQAVLRVVPSTVPIIGGDLEVLRPIIVGILLIVVMYVRPQGMFGNKEQTLAGVKE